MALNCNQIDPDAGGRCRKGISKMLCQADASNLHCTCCKHYSGCGWMHVTKPLQAVEICVVSDMWTGRTIKAPCKCSNSFRNDDSARSCHAPLPH